MNINIYIFVALSAGKPVSPYHHYHHHQRTDVDGRPIYYIYIRVYRELFVFKHHHHVVCCPSIPEQRTSFMLHSAAKYSSSKSLYGKADSQSGVLSTAPNTLVYVWSTYHSSRNWNRRVVIASNVCINDAWPSIHSWNSCWNKMCTLRAIRNDYCAFICVCVFP